METEVLNEYLFADLVAGWSVNPRAARLTALKEAGQAEPGIKTFTETDLAEGLRRLEEARRVVRGLLPTGP